MLRLFIIVLLFLLSGCASDAGLHAHVRPLPYCASAPPCNPCLPNCAWWEIFHDPQLNQLIATGLSDAPTIDEAEARMAIAVAAVQTSYSTLWPGFDLNGSITRTHYARNGLFPPPIGGSTLTEGILTVNMQYDFDIWGKHRKELAAAISKARAQKADAAMVRLTLSTAIANTYFQLQGTLKQIQITQLILQQRQHLQQLQLLRAKHGLAPYDQLRTTQANVANSVLSLAQMQENAQVLRDQLAALIGQGPDAGVCLAIAPQNTNPNIVPVPESVPADLLAQRPDVIALRWQIEAANQQVAAAKTEFYPNVNLAAYVGFDGIPLNNVFTAGGKEAEIGPAFDLPIFHGGRTRANLRSKYASYDLAVAEYNQSVLNAMQQVADQIAIMRALQTQQVAQAANLRAITQVYKLTDARFQHGLQNGLDVIQAQFAVLQQQQAQIQTHTQYLQAVVSMIKALGGNYPCS